MTRVTSIRLPDELIARLDQIALALDRSRGWVIRQALLTYVQLQEAAATLTPPPPDEAASGAPQPTPLENVIAALEHMIEDAAKRAPETSPTDDQPHGP